MAILLLKWFLLPLWLVNPLNQGKIVKWAEHSPSPAPFTPLPGPPLLIYSINTYNHPYYVSVSELEWNENERQVELSIKIFIDDFEEALKQPGAKTDLVKGDQGKNKAQIESYIRKHFQVRINGKPIVLQIVGYENDQEATWSYFQSPLTEPPVKIEIANTILYESKKEQVNIVHLKSGNDRKSFRLVNPESSIQWNPGK